MRLSVGRRGQCWDNAVAESFFAIIKTELLDRQAWPTRATAETAIFDWIEGRAGTTPAAGTPPSATSAPPPTEPLGVSHPPLLAPTRPDRQGIAGDLGTA
ncbi:integrase core domain-containing protein [Micromonospora carbonacea]|uniref:integrase core domain-containing protein n=1 Tax=Micromonospora carbonacea TaxID=47853 RepID=UPI0037189C79